MVVNTRAGRRSKGSSSERREWCYCRQRAELTSEGSIGHAAFLVCVDSWDVLCDTSASDG
jgi:hypothetical protein